MTSVLAAAKGVSGIALPSPAPTRVLIRKAAAIKFFMENLRLNELNERVCASAAHQLVPVREFNRNAGGKQMPVRPDRNPISQRLPAGLSQV
jgi:hypothetical protein